MDWQWIVSAVFAAGGAWMAVRVELRWMRADMDDLKKRVRHLEWLRRATDIE